MKVRCGRCHEDELRRLKSDVFVFTQEFSNFELAKYWLLPCAGLALTVEFPMPLSCALFLIRGNRKGHSELQCHLLCALL
jgi:hypothetical protein